jgi:hypothetical protein
MLSLLLIKHFLLEISNSRHRQEIYFFTRLRPKVGPTLPLNQWVTPAVPEGKAENTHHI